MDHLVLLLDRVDPRSLPSPRNSGNATGPVAMDSDHESDDDFNNNDDARSDDGSERGDADDGKERRTRLALSHSLFGSIQRALFDLFELFNISHIRYSRECHPSWTTRRPNGSCSSFILHNRRNRTGCQDTSTHGLATSYPGLQNL